MEEIKLYQQFFEEKDAGKPYQSLEEYLKELFYLLDGYVQIAFLLTRGTVEDLGELQTDTCLMEKHIESRRQESTNQLIENRLIEMEETFSLTAFERFQIIMGLSTWYNPIYESYYRSLQPYLDTGHPTKGLAISLYQALHEISGEERKKLFWNESPAIQLFFCKEQNAKGPSDRLVLERGVAKYLLGQEEFYRFQEAVTLLEIWEQTLQGRERLSREQANSGLQNDAVKQLRNLWDCREEETIILQLHGNQGVEKRQILKEFLREIHKNGLLYPLENLLDLPIEQGIDVLYKLFANGVLTNAVTCLTLQKLPEEVVLIQKLQKILEEAEKLFGFCLVITESLCAELFPLCSGYAGVEVMGLSAEERLMLWKNLSGNVKYEEEVNLEAIINKHYTTPGEMKNIIHTAKRYAMAKGKSRVGEEEISEAFRTRQRGYLSHLALPINAVYTWEDLVVSEGMKAQLMQICNRIKYKHVVEEKWGFQEKLAYGKGISALFYGPPGTGKTMAAQVLANELGMELYRIDISRIHSKYIGETEKNLSELFETMKHMNAILFFDEADALFAKRSEVKNSNDRNANAVTAHLLQKLEEHEGITILATNFSESIDDAFKRRMKFMLQFEYPTEELRKRIFETVLPGKAECMEYLAMDFFAKHFELSGSNIKEILVNAAFLAAAEGQGIGNKHVIEAIKQNYLKYGKLLTNQDFGYLI